MSAQKFTVNLSESELDAKDGVKEKVNLASSENIELVPEENLDGKERASLPELYQGFNPSDISRAELDELLALQKAARQLYKERLSDWRSQDKATRGPKPERGAVAASEEDEKRLRSLNAKLWIAINRKNYERYGKDFVSSEEIDEIIALEKQESQSLLNRKNKYRSELENWEIQDPVIRGEKPSMDKPLFTGSSPRAMELKEKIYRVEEISRLRRRLRNISPSDNVLLLDSDITEWSELRQER